MRPFDRRRSNRDRRFGRRHSIEATARHVFLGFSSSAAAAAFGDSPAVAAIATGRPAATRRAVHLSIAHFDRQPKIVVSTLSERLPNFVQFRCCSSDNRVVADLHGSQLDASSTNTGIASRASSKESFASLALGRRADSTATTTTATSIDMSSARTPLATGDSRVSQSLKDVAGGGVEVRSTLLISQDA